MASTKVEAKRFSGKAEQWPHWDQSLQAYLAVNDLIEYFSDGQGVHRDKKDDWKKAQKKIYAYILLVCDGRAADTLLGINAAHDDVGWQAYSKLKDKYGSEKAQQLSQLAKALLGFKQGSLSHADYLTDMRKKVTQIEKVAGNDATKIWRIINSRIVQIRGRGSQA